MARVVFTGTAGKNEIPSQHVTGTELAAVSKPSIELRKVNARQVQQLLEAVNDEVRLLKVINPVSGTHHSLQIETNAVRRQAVQCEDTLRKD